MFFLQLQLSFPPTASEKKSLASRSSVTHHSKATSWSGSLSSAMRLMPGRQAKDPECRAEVSLEPLTWELSQGTQTPVALSPLCCLLLVIAFHNLWGCAPGFPAGAMERRARSKAGFNWNWIWVTLGYQEKVFLEHLHFKKRIHFETRRTCFKF